MTEHRQVAGSGPVNGNMKSFFVKMFESNLLCESRIARVKDKVNKVKYRWNNDEGFTKFYRGIEGLSRAYKNSNKIEDTEKRKEMLNKIRVSAKELRSFYEYDKEYSNANIIEKKYTRSYVSRGSFISTAMLSLAEILQMGDKSLELASIPGALAILSFVWRKIKQARFGSGTGVMYSETGNE